MVRRRTMKKSTTPEEEEEEQETPTRRVTRQMTALSRAITPAMQPARRPVFSVGARVEVRLNEFGYRGSWFEAFVADLVPVRGRIMRYIIEYVSLVKEDEPDLPETDEVSVDDVRPEAPRRLQLTDGKENSDPEFELYDLVEAYHNEGWWYGVVSGLRNAETGKYRVSFPFSNEAFEFSPSEIRPQMSFINGNWFRVESKPQKEEIYKTGDKVEASKIREKYGQSWFPSTIEKIITDNIFLIKYENNANSNGYLTEIVDCSWLRPLTSRNPKSNNIILNSDVEFFHEGAWSNGIVTCVNSDGNYLIKFDESDDVAPELFSEGFVRLSLQWDGKKWSKGKRRRPAVKASSVPAKKIKNDISPRGGTSVPLSGLEKFDFVLANQNGNCTHYKTVKRAVAKLPKSKVRNDSSPSSVSIKTNKGTSREPSECTGSPADAGADISKGKMVNTQNGGQDQTTPSSKSVSNNNLISTPQNPNPNQVSTPQNPNPSESSPSSSVSGNIILPFEWRSPVWNSVHALDVFRKIPQNPHFANLQKCCKKGELEGEALGKMVNYANLAASIKDLSLDAELAEFHDKLEILNSLQLDGFETDPLRIRLNTMIESKKAICESSLKRREKESELIQREEDNDEVLGNVDRIGAELAEVRAKVREWVERERRLRERRERELERSAGNGDRIRRLRSEISRLDRNVERARDEFLVASKDHVWNY